MVPAIKLTFSDQYSTVSSSRFKIIISIDEKSVSVPFNLLSISVTFLSNCQGSHYFAPDSESTLVKTVRRDIIKIKKYKLKPAEYCIKTTVTDPNNPISGYAISTLKVLDIPNSGSCSLSSNNNIEFQNKTEIQCNLWVTDAAAFPLEYFYEISDSGKGDYYLVSYGQHSSHFSSLSFPEGTYDIRVQISDRMGSSNGNPVILNLTILASPEILITTRQLPRRSSFKFNPIQKYIDYMDSYVMLSISSDMSLSSSLSSIALVTHSLKSFSPAVSQPLRLKLLAHLFSLKTKYSLYSTYGVATVINDILYKIAVSSNGTLSLGEISYITSVLEISIPQMVQFLKTSNYVISESFIFRLVATLSTSFASALAINVPLQMGSIYQIKTLIALNVLSTFECGEHSNSTESFKIGIDIQNNFCSIFVVNTTGCISYTCGKSTSKIASVKSTVSDNMDTFYELSFYNSTALLPFSHSITYTIPIDVAFSRRNSISRYSNGGSSCIWINVNGLNTWTSDGCNLISINSETAACNCIISGSVSYFSLGIESKLPSSTSNNNIFNSSYTDPLWISLYVLICLVLVSLLVALIWKFRENLLKWIESLYEFLESSISNIPRRKRNQTTRFKRKIFPDNQDIYGEPNKLKTEIKSTEGDSNAKHGIIIEDNEDFQIPIHRNNDVEVIDIIKEDQENNVVVVYDITNPKVEIAWPIQL